MIPPAEKETAASNRRSMKRAIAEICLSLHLACFVYQSRGSE